MIPWLSGFLMSPWLAVFGLLAIASPIIIHLLNRRRFKIVDWAAMEFLVDADKKNRRRVRLENLLLLALRCLVMLLLGLLLARPFLQSSLTTAFLDSPQFERIVLLDDSLSMQAQAANQSAMDEAKRSLIEIARGLVDNQSDDNFTLFLTSQPDTPILHSQHVTAASVEELVAEVERLQPSDKTANLTVALQELERYVTSEKANVNRVIYVVTDLRERDWHVDESADEASQPAQTLQRLSKITSGCLVVDVGSEEQDNLAITAIRPEATLIAGVASRFDVTVTNYAEQAAQDIRVRLVVGDSIPLEEEIDRIEAGKSETVQFNFTFTADDGAVDRSYLEQSEQDGNRHTSSVKVIAQLVSSRPGQQDRLLADSERFFAARIVRGIPTLLVDGDPSAVYGRSESFYLKPALAPPGEVLSGIVVDVATDTELEMLSLSKYRVIILCNVYRLSEDRIAALTQWTSDGGGLVLMPGDQVDDDAFNQDLFQDGRGLSPLRLEGLEGDETHRRWVNFRIEQSNHPALRVFAGQNNPFLDRVKIFRWWGGSVLQEQLGTTVSVKARLTDEDQRPAIAEKAFGKGRVVAMALPADADWTNWPDDYCFLVTMQELVRYMAGKTTLERDLRVGQPLSQPLDLVEYRETASLRLPDDQRVTVQAVHLVDDEVSEANTVRQIDYPEVDRRGFYELHLTRTTGQDEQMLFAVNTDPTEGQLRPLDQTGRQKLSQDNVRIVTGNAAAAQMVRGSSIEIWKYLLVLAVSVLCGEQLLGWYFGLYR